MLRKKARRLHISAGWLAALSVLLVAALIAVSAASFNGSFTSSIPVTLTSDRAGLVMEPYAKVKMRGVQVGRVATIAGGTSQVSIRLDIDPDQIKYIPANVEARINATSLFGAKFIDLITPKHPSPQRLKAGTVLRSQNVAIEVNTVFNNLVDLIHHVDPAKLNGVLSALAEGLSGQGDRIGEAITDTNVVLASLNPRTDKLRADWQALKNVSDTYSAAAPDLIKTLSAASTTSTTVTTQAQQLDALLLDVLGLSRSGVNLLAPSKDKLITAINSLQPTADLLMKYNPELTCLFQGTEKTLDYHSPISGGQNGKSLIMDAQIMFGDDPYRFPENLPIVNAKGGPGGKPGCGSLPDVSKNWPARYLVTDTGYGSGIDVRPNPGIGFPGYDNFFPVTKGTPQPPLIRYPGGPAPGPIPYPGAPPYGAPLYSPDGSPLYPGVPPAPPPPAASPPGP